MAQPTTLAGTYIDETYQRLVQVEGGIFTDGTGSLITFGTTPTGSLLLTASVFLNTIEFTKGDNTKFSITVDTGSFATTGSNTFRGNQTITGSIIFNSGSQITSTYYGNNYPGYIDIVAGAPDGFVELLSYNQSSSVNVDDYSVYITTQSGSLFNLWEFKNSGRLVASIAGGIEAPSFTGSLQGTASYALTASYAMNGGGTNVDTGSFVTTSSFNAFTQSINTATSSFVTNAQTSSFVTTSSFNTFTSSYNTFTSSYNTGSFSGSLVGTASFATTASYALTTAGGKVISSINTNTTAGSASFTDYIYLVLGSSTVTLTLPTAINNTNLYTIKNVGISTASIATTAGQTIDGSSSPININVQYVSLTLVSDNANWNII